MTSSDQVIIESLEKTIEMFDQENCIMVATYNLWLQVNTFPAGQGRLQMARLGTVLFCSLQQVSVSVMNGQSLYLLISPSGEGRGEGGRE